MKTLTKNDYFCVLYRQGAEWIPRKPVREQPLTEHLAYMRDLQNRGTLALGGPFKDDAGGMIVLEADSLRSAVEISEKDPAVQAKILSCEVHPWHPAATGHIEDRAW